MTVTGGSVTPPKDHYHMVYIISVIVGTAMLLPYNAFISTPAYTKDYYKYAAGDPNATTSNPHVWHNIENYLMAASMVPNFGAQLLLMSKFGRGLPIFPRLMVSLTLMFIFVLLIVIVPFFKVSDSMALTTIIGVTALTNTGAAVLQASFFSLAAAFPFQITQGVMLGIGVSGTTASGLAALIKLSMNDGFHDNEIKARIYFGIALGALVLALICCILLRKNEFVKFYVDEFRDHGDDYLTNEGDFSEQATLMKTESSMVFVNMKDTLRLVVPMLFSVFWTFFISLFVFPSFGVKLHPDNDWFGIIIIFMFNIGDLCGRFLCRFSVLHLPRKAVIAGAAARTVLVLLFFLCIKPMVITSIPFQYCLMYVTGVTNGFFGSQSMMLAPSSPGIKTEGQRGVVGNAMSVGLLAGAAGGSLVSLAVVPQL